ARAEECEEALLIDDVDDERRRGRRGAVRGFHATVEEGVVARASRAPLPGDAAPDAPVVVVIRLRGLVARARPTHADGAAGVGARRYGAGEATCWPPLFVQRDEELTAPSPSRVANGTGDHEGDERPLPTVGRDHVEVVPLRPARIAFHLGGRQMEVIDVVTK